MTAGCCKHFRRNADRHPLIKLWTAHLTTLTPPDSHEISNVIYRALIDTTNQPARVCLINLDPQLDFGKNSSVILFAPQGID